jgi:predicted amidohydrolase YtcJ
MTVYEGTIITCDESGSVHRYLVEDRGLIAFSGDVLPPEFARVPRVDLGKGSLAPAFADTHIHFMSYALFSGGLDVSSAGSLADSLGEIRRFSESFTGPVVIGFGASPHAVAEGRLPQRAELDLACPGKPAFIVKYDGHACIVNSKLLAALPEGVAGLRGYDPDSGLMTQEAFFRITDFVSSKVSLVKTLDDMLAAVDRLAAYGIGLVHSVTGVGFPLDADVTLESLFARGLRNPMAYRIFFQTMDVGKVKRRGLPRIGGCFATALDGCFGSADAALNEQYRGDVGNSGVLYYPDSRIRDFAREANRAGLQIEMHAIGDRAFDQAVDAIQSALEDFPREDHRHTIIHACLPTESGLEACARLRIGIALQPAFLQWRQEPLGYLEEILGDRAYRLSPLRRMTDMGILLSAGSDAPCTVPDPIRGIWSACNHYVPGESLTIQEALNLYTRNAARTSFDEKERGSLEKGKIADLVRLNANPLAMAPKDLLALKVDGLILSGKPYRPGQGKVDLLLHSLVSRRKI